MAVEINQKFNDAIVAFREDVGTIAKDGSNPHFKSRYATLPGILDAIAGPMKKHGLTFHQMPDGLGRLMTVIAHRDGGHIEGVIEMRSPDDKAQTYGSMITYSRRYALVTMLGLNVDEDDDGNAASAVKPKAAKADPTNEQPF